MSATALARSVFVTLVEGVRPFLLSRLLAPVMATGSDSSALTRSRRNPLTILMRSAHSPRRAARSAEAGSFAGHLIRRQAADRRLSASAPCIASTFWRSRPLPADRRRSSW